MNNFQIDFKDKKYTYNLGSSNEAKQACYGLELYKKTAQYDDLRRMIANLNWIVSEGGSDNKNACLATQAFSLTVFPKLSNDYQKAFIAISVTSIY